MRYAAGCSAGARLVNKFGLPASGWLNIVRPDAVAGSKALLFVTGDANDGRVPKSADGNLVRMESLRRMDGAAKARGGVSS
jgi:hypothetical protein